MGNVFYAIGHALNRPQMEVVVADLVWKTDYCPGKDAPFTADEVHAFARGLLHDRGVAGVNELVSIWRKGHNSVGETMSRARTIVNHLFPALDD